MPSPILALAAVLSRPALAVSVTLFGYQVEVTPAAAAEPAAPRTSQNSLPPVLDAAEEMEAALDGLAEDTPAQAPRAWDRPALGPAPQTVRPSPVDTSMVFIDEDVEIRPGGYTAVEVEDAMDDLGPALRACVPDRRVVTGRIPLRLTVSADGRVTALEMEPPASLPGEVGSCLDRTLRESTFPPHQQADGFTFDYLLGIGL